MSFFCRDHASRKILPIFSNVGSFVIGIIIYNYCICTYMVCFSSFFGDKDI
jgi:hypothetical protein